MWQLNRLRTTFYQSISLRSVLFCMHVWRAVSGERCVHCVCVCPRARNKLVRSKYRTIFSWLFVFDFGLSVTCRILRVRLPNAQAKKKNSRQRNNHRWEEVNRLLFVMEFRTVIQHHLECFKMSNEKFSTVQPLYVCTRTVLAAALCKAYKFVCWLSERRRRRRRQRTMMRWKKNVQHGTYKSLCVMQIRFAHTRAHANFCVSIASDFMRLKKCSKQKKWRKRK